ncbi:MAG: hypothetical protein GF329_06920 [Candidatus Lokiarchaeota archaeon]|nr:hypothetical protein [Candidatus Lokiarchaeota archaeon]
MSEFSKSMNTQKRVILKEVDDIQSILEMLEEEIEHSSYDEIIKSIGKLNTSIGIFIDDLKTL